MVAKEKTKFESEDELSSIIFSTINKKGSKDIIAYRFDDENAPSFIKGYISTGSEILDMFMTNERHGGIPLGRITLVSSPEHAGKSLLAAHAMVSCQKMGGVSVFIDTENAISVKFLEAIGLDTSLESYIYVPTNYIETVFETIDNVAKILIERNEKRPTLVVVDSLTATTTKTHMQDSFDLKGYNTAGTIITSDSLKRLITTLGRANMALLITSQLRQKIGATAFEDPYTMPGGMAPKHFSSIIVRLKKTANVTLSGKKDPIGIRVTADMKKNRIAPSNRKCSFIIRYDSGIDNVRSIMETAKEYGIIKVSGPSTKFVRENGEEIKFTSSNLSPISSREVLDEILDKLFKEIYVPYRTSGEVLDDDIVENEDSEEKAISDGDL